VEGSATSLRQSLANVEAQIATLTASVRPDYSLDGQSESLSTHLKNLFEVRKQLIDAIIQSEGPTEVHVVGTT
jgi:hypothetical protein